MLVDPGAEAGWGAFLGYARLCWSPAIARPIVSMYRTAAVRSAVI